MKKLQLFKSKYLFLLLFAVLSLYGFQTINNGTGNDELFLLEAEVTDIGKVTPFSEVFLRDKVNLFPERLPEIIEGLDFTKLLRESGRVKRISSQKKGTVYIAMMAPDFFSTEWKNLHKEFSVNSEKFHLYSLSYQKPGEWISIPQPENSSVLVFAEELQLAHVNPPGTVIARSIDPKLHFVTDPSIIILPDGNYIAGCKSRFDGENSTFRIFNSSDRGETWSKVSDLKEVGFCSLFTHKGALYLMGTKGGFNHVIIRKSTDGGKTWTTPTDHSTGLLMGGSKSFHSAPVPVVVHNGRIWRTMEDNIPLGGRNFRAFVMSAPQDADLLDSASWTSSIPMPFREKWLSGGRTFDGWLEGNVVVKPDGNIANILRIEERTFDGKAALITIGADGKSTSFDPEKDIIDFPGGSKKFVIRYDSISEKYWSITNHTFYEELGKVHLGKIHCGLTRNRVVLTWSKNLRNWNISDTLISNNDPYFHGYQYLDWQFDEEDIIAVSRTAHEYPKGLPVRQHDANYMTFHRFSNFRE